MDTHKQGDENLDRQIEQKKLFLDVKLVRYVKLVGKGYGCEAGSEWLENNVIDSNPHPC